MPDEQFNELLNNQSLGKLAEQEINKYIVDSFFNFGEKPKKEKFKDNYMVWTLNYSINRREEESSKGLKDPFQRQFTCNGALLKNK